EAATEVCHQGNKINKQPTTARSQGFHSFLKLSSNPLRGTLARKPERRTDFYFYRSRRREPFLRFLQFKESINSHGHDRDREIIRQQSHTGAKRTYLAVGCVVSFGKNQDAVAAVDRLSGKVEA